MNFESMPTPKSKPEQKKPMEITPEEERMIKEIDGIIAESKQKEREPIIELTPEKEVHEKVVELKPEQIVQPSVEERIARTREQLFQGKITPLPEKPKEKRAKPIPPEIKAMFTKNGKIDVPEMTKYMNEHFYGIGAKPKENPGAEQRQ